MSKGRLVSLELNNFKSYRGVQIIGPFRDFSSVCGPNGSGKSNLMDAISFVLGIRSSQLRSSHLRDLISTGEQDASVTAIFNDGSRDWRFSRRIGSTQGSDYSVDGRSVSASEYNAILESHNILIRARNFLVFQGDVEAVASQSPKDLTKLIEQISGSIEYRAEYERLKAEQEKAIELSALSFHAKRSVNSDLRQFADQQREAKAYKRKADEREGLMQQQILWKLKRIDVQIEEDRSKLRARYTEADDSRRGLDSVDAELKRAEQEHLRALKAVRKAKQTVREREDARSEQLPKIDAAEERMAALQKAMFSQNRKIRELEHELADNKISEYERDLDRLHVAEARFEQQMKDRQTTDLSDADYDAYRGLRDQADKALAAEKEQLDGQRQRQRILGEQIASLQQRAHDEQMHRQALQDSLQAAIAQLHAQEENVQGASAELNDVVARAQKIADERSSLERQELDLNDKLRETLEELADLGALEAETKKEGRMRALGISLRNIFPGVRGRVVELVKATQSRHDAAIQLALGRNLDSFIVDTEKTARDCIEYMREQQTGVATFLPLDTLAPKPLRAELLSIGKNARLAINCLHYSAAIERAVQYACGDTLICDTLEEARELAYTRRIGVKVITVEGTIIHKSGNLTGGQTPRTTSTSSVSMADVEGLRRVQDSLMSQLSTLTKKRRQLAETTVSALEVDAIRARLQIVQRDRDAAGRIVDGLREQIAALEETAQTDLAAVQQRKSAVDRTVDQVLAVVTARENDLFRDFCARLSLSSIQDYESSQGQLRQEAARQRATFAAHRSRLENSLSFEQLKREETTSRLAKLRDMHLRDETALRDTQAQRDLLLDGVHHAENELAEAKSAVTRATQTLDERSVNVDVARRSSFDKASELDQVLSRASNLETAIAKSLNNAHAILKRCKLEEINLPLLRGSLDAVPLEQTGSRQQSLNDMIESWALQIDYEELDDNYREPDEETGNRLEQKLQDVDLELERLRPNLRAIERLQGVELRHSETERDFDASRRAVKLAKEQFNAVKRKRLQLFNAAYEHIAGSIDEVYKSLTRSSAVPIGGTAHMSLEDSDEPYLAGVKYHAMPPMKRFRDMDQLSGGEKTMAALALLFAVHNYSPSPFFVLDEVDAALDNANVERIANYIQANAGDKLQFLVISLKNKLFHKSDGLVGIYRDSAMNSSRSLTVDLAKYISA
ncbi:Structural maintenance of chromosomes protein 1 [Savitreella phatthalungensis]